MVDVIQGSFVWDMEKDAYNQKVHGVSFAEASWAFLDEDRLIEIDDGHSQDEDRFFCIGKVGSKIVTVRFTHRHDRVRIIGAGRWRKGRKLYEKENKKCG